MLKIENLSKTYANGTRALNDLSLEIPKGMYGLLGPNGAGKSTLMRTIATLQSPDQGRISFEGIDALQSPLELKKILGYLPQDFGVYPRVSAVRLLDYLASLKGIISRKDRRKMVQKVLGITNLEEVQHKHVSGYSGGMRQRFGIAQMLLNQPRLVIVDEPTAGLDPAERNRFLQVIRAVASENTVIFSTHIVEDVRDLCSGMAIISGGQIVREGAPRDLTEELQGKIWSKSIAADTLPGFQSRFNVLSSQLNEFDRLTLRIHAQNHPEQGFEPVTPRLEDVYFLSLPSPQL